MPAPMPSLLPVTSATLPRSLLPSGTGVDWGSQTALLTKLLPAPTPMHAKPAPASGSARERASERAQRNSITERRKLCSRLHLPNRA